MEAASCTLGQAMTTAVLAQNCQPSDMLHLTLQIDWWHKAAQHRVPTWVSPSRQTNNMPRAVKIYFIEAWAGGQAWHHHHVSNQGVQETSANRRPHITDR